MKRIWSVLLFAGCLCAQNDSISVNGTPLKAGMPKSEALASLAENSEFTKIKGLDDAWCVKAKSEHGTQDSCGAFIQFSGDKLSAASRTLSSATGDAAAALISSFFSTLDELYKSGKTDVSFNTQEVETEQHMRVRIITFFAGNKEYRLTTMQPIGSRPSESSSVDLQESFITGSNRSK